MRQNFLWALAGAACVLAMPCRVDAASIPEQAAAVSAQIQQVSIPQNVRVNVVDKGAIMAP